jgi:hypothetical protein
MESTVGVHPPTATERGNILRTLLGSGNDQIGGGVTRMMAEGEHKAEAETVPEQQALQQEKQQDQQQEHEDEQVNQLHKHKDRQTASVASRLGCLVADAVSVEALVNETVRCAFFDRSSHPRVALRFMPLLCVKHCQACERCHSSRVPLSYLFTL